MTGAPILIPRPDPLTVLVPAWGASWGVVGAVTSFLAPEDVSAAIPKWGVLGFFVGLLVTSALTLMTLVPRDAKRLRRNVWAWLGLGSVSFTYSGWALMAFGLKGYAVVSLLFIISVASFWQARRLNVALSRPEE